MSSDTIPSIVRVLFAYIFGMLIEHWWSRSSRRMTIPTLLPSALLLGALALPVSNRFNAPIDLFLVFLVLPTTLALSAHATTGRLLHRPAHLLGLASYPVYLLQFPILILFLLATHNLHFNSTMSPVPAHWFLYIALVITIALFAESLYDRPVRGRLRAALRA